MKDPAWLAYITAIGSVATPIFVLLLTAIGWRLRARLERRAALEDKLRDDRVKIYDQILEPFIILLTSDEAWRRDPKSRDGGKYEYAEQKMVSLEYRNSTFRMALIGSDAVVRSYNDLWYYISGNSTPGAAPVSHDAKEIMSKLGQFLLEIRKSMGNESTKLNNWDMIELFVRDAMKYRR